MTPPQSSNDPIHLIAAWLQAGRDAGAPLAEAMTVATIAPGGWPSARLVILRGIDRGLVFFTDRESTKGLELGAVPRAAVVLHWVAPLHRQVRAAGAVETVSDEEADSYWSSRHRGAQLSAAASVQSQVVAGRDVLEDRVARLTRELPTGVAVPRPARWGGYRVIPAEVELWQEAADGLHDRLRYRRAGGAWTVERLAP